MLTQRELIDAIRECENAPVSYQNCQRLATFYGIYDHMFPPEVQTGIKAEKVIEDYGKSDFLLSVGGKNAEKVWNVMDELMSTLQAVNPKLYEGVLRKIDDL
ncbi:MAG: hypothetical protein K2K16_12955 [Ruminococcus sp.]|nr:hypothetical protein [Ruminococcus sp.]